MQKPRIVTIPELKLVGKSIHTSLAENRTVELWSSFKPEVRKISQRTNTGFYSVQVFDKGLSFNQFTPQTKFEKWAAIEVNKFEKVPEGLQAYALPGGKYAVFIHKGKASEFAKTSRYIHTQWMPASLYELDQRPHFEIMEEGYSPNDPDAEEEVWIPIK